MRGATNRKVIMSKFKFSIVVVSTLIVGVLVGLTLHGAPNKYEVRKVLHDACAESSEMKLSSCTKQEIDLLIAQVYGDTHIPPVIPGNPEAVLHK